MIWCIQVRERSSLAKAEPMQIPFHAEDIGLPSGAFRRPGNLRARRVQSSHLGVLLGVLIGVIVMALQPLAMNGQEKQPAESLHNALDRNESANLPRSAEPAVTEAAAASSDKHGATQKLIVIGFMGGSVSATNKVHREAALIDSLQQREPQSIRAALFANRSGNQAMQTVLQSLGADPKGQLTEAAKQSARIVIFGHSWGASETVHLARRLNRMGIPVLLTVQVDSVQKQSQNDRRIPPNVREAINFYQSEGLLRGRPLIVAEDPAKTKILGNHQSSYRENPVSVAGYPWYARAFMHRHIQIENDPAVWNQIEGLILAKVL
jgi:hypothetical protein